VTAGAQLTGALKMETNNSIAQFERAMAKCSTNKEAAELIKTQFANDDVMREARELRLAYTRIKNERCKQIRSAELAPFEDEAKRLRQGQKVYFARSCNSVALDWNLRSVAGSEKKIEAGGWCYVWEYQPKSKALWLCRPGKKCEYKNLIRAAFSVSDMMHYGISRTELKLRK